jgi:O-antigen/teichoic acid export membrane protein
MAEAGATRLFIAPLALMNVSLMRILMPRWVTLRAEGEISRISSSGRKALWLMLGIVVAYLAVLYPFRHFLAGKFLTSEYTDITILLLLWGIHFLLQFQRSNISAQLQVFLQFRRITTANLASSVVVIIVGCILISAYGVRGSIVSLIIGELVLTLLLWRSLRNVS